MLVVLLLPIVAQTAVMAVDEGFFHRRRGLPRWERLGHPVDTLSVAACYAWLVGGGGRYGYAALAVLSSLLVTKDEPVHARACSPGEHWCHALLFVLHPMVFLAVWLGAASGHAPWLPSVMLGASLVFALYQFGYWRWFWKSQPQARAR
jgi:hypothetical protein